MVFEFFSFECLWVAMCGHLAGIKKGKGEKMGELLSTYVLEKRWVGLNVWQQEAAGCASDSDGVCLRRDHDSHVSQAGLLFWAGCRGWWEMVLDGSKKHMSLQANISVAGPFDSTVDILPGPVSMPFSLDLQQIIDSKVTDRHLSVF